MPYANLVIDLSHYNSVADLQNAQAAGVLGIIHKASQGTTFPDAQYAPRREQAREQGLLWGAYHFGNGDDGIAQAEYFLNAASPDSETLLILDFESNPAGSTMSLEEARDFVTHIQSITGNWPGLYGGSYLKEKLGVGSDPVLANCWLWLAQYGPTAVVPPNWPSWTLWQWTDGHIVPDTQPIPGISPCDRSYYIADAAQLQSRWAAGSLQ
jgi:lysozyme